MKTDELPEPVAAKLSGIARACRQFGVQRLEVFGSAVTGRYDLLKSDIDFVVTFPPGADLGPWLGRLQDLRQELRDVMGRPVDLVLSEALVGTRFGEHVIETRRLCFDG